ncbi:MAG: bifunctional precorrin-2 dehydrogenase/sirohydrochlorin ferrochelatase, partial [bacterium]|nr:bifunctional precorrin-2 dehydrogenase/sirohydrochlorin ferrochelatase [bacterium]
MYPITLDLNKKSVLIIGAGSVGERKINTVCEA